MFWMQKRVWLELLGMIILAFGFSVFAWATNDTPEELRLKIRELTFQKEFLEEEKLEPLQDFKECVSDCNRYSALRPEDYWKLRDKTTFTPDNMPNRRFEFLLECNRKCFME